MPATVERVLAYCNRIACSGTLAAFILTTSAHASQHCIFNGLTGSAADLNEFKRCTLEASVENSISPGLLVALKRTESGLNVNPSVVNQNADGSVDIGVMQINYPL